VAALLAGDSLFLSQPQWLEQMDTSTASSLLGEEALAEAASARMQPRSTASAFKVADAALQLLQQLQHCGTSQNWCNCQEPSGRSVHVAHLITPA